MCFFWCNWSKYQKADSRDGLLVVHKTKRASIRIPIYRKVSRRTCPLLDYTWEMRWTNVVDRCISHPSEACCVSSFTGRTALHLASLNHGSPDFVARALLHANPHALLKQDSYGQTPLHIASQYASGTNNLVLLYCATLVELASRSEANKDVVVNACPPIMEASPLYLACDRSAIIDVVKALVKTRTTIGTCWIAPVTGGEAFFPWQDDQQQASTSMNDGIQVDNATKTPLSVAVELCPDFNVDPTTVDDSTIGVRLLKEMKNTGESILNSDNREPQFAGICNLLIMACWLKSIVLLKPHYQSLARDSQGASLLHLVAALRVPVPALAAWCARVFPETLLQQDANGYIPLHYALLNPSSSKQSQDYVIMVLVRSQPDAAKVAFPCNGQSTTLVVALQQQRPWWWHGYLEELDMANPDALAQRDDESGFHPYQLAASLDADLSTIYGLLRLRPDLLAL